MDILCYYVCIHTHTHMRRAWQPTPVFLPGEFHGQGSLAGYSPWNHKESDTTEQLTRYISVQTTNTHTHTEEERIYVLYLR